MKKVNLISLYFLINLISSSICVFSRFDDEDYDEFSSNFADPHLDIQRNVKIKRPITTHPDDHAHRISESFEFRNDHSFKNDDELKSDRFKDEQFKDEQFKDDHFNDDFRRDPFKLDSFKQDPFKKDLFKNDPFKRDPFRRDPFKNDYFTKTDPFKSDTFKTDLSKIEIPKIELPKPADKANIVVLKKKEPKNDDSNKSDTFLNEFNTNFDDIPRIPDFDFHEHDSWFEKNRDIDIPRGDREKLINDYRQPTPRTPFRVPMIPVVCFK